MKLSRSKTALILLVVYWVAIFVLTHIPLKHISFLVTKVNVSDKILHFIAYFMLSFLLWIALSQSQKLKRRKSRVWWILFLIFFYALLDEWLQMYVGRSPSVYDFIADISGAITALILISIFPHFSDSENSSKDNHSCG